MKVMHRVKAIDSYKGAKIVLSEGLVYPSYMLIKESLRGTLSYILEDLLDKELSNKTKFEYLIEQVEGFGTEDRVLLSDDIETLDIILKAEKSGLQSIMALEVKDLNKVRKLIKKLISTYMDERL